MPKPNESFTPDLRDRVKAHLGKPLAASAHASLWRYPVCSPDTYSLLMVSGDEYRCLGHFVCGGGANEWLQDIDQSQDDSILIGEPA